MQITTLLLMKTYLLPILLCVLSISFVQAQSSFGLNFNLANPQQEFKENINRLPAGISFDFVRSVKESRLSVGGELGVAMFFDDEFRYELSEEGRPGEFITLYEEDCYLSYAAVARYSAFKHAFINPYLEGRLGGTSFFSTRLAVETTPYFDDITRFHGTAFNAGIGAGFQINFCSTPLSLDFATLANSGTHTVYRSITDTDSGAIRLSDGRVASKTNHLNFRFGLRFRL